MCVIEGYVSRWSLYTTEHDAFPHKYLTVPDLCQTPVHVEEVCVGGNNGITWEYTETATQDASVCVYVCVCVYDMYRHYSPVSMMGIWEMKLKLLH